MMLHPVPGICQGIMCRRLYIVLFLLLHLYIYPQSLNLKNYDPRSGLSGSETYHAIQDRQGYIWIASDAGVSRFDGKQFTRYTKEDGLTDNTVFRIYEDHKGRIWFPTYSGGISYFEDEKIHNIAANDSLKKLLSYKFEIIVSFEVDSGDTIRISYNSRREYIKILPGHHFKDFELISVDNCQRNINFRKGSASPMYTYNTELNASRCLEVSFPDTSYRFNVETGNNSKVPMFVMMLSTKKNEFFFSIFNVLYHFSKNTLVSEKEFPHRIIALCMDRSENLWVGVYRHGVYIFGDAGIQDEPENYLGQLSVTHVLEDHENGFWFTTLEKGIYYSPSPEIFHLDLPENEQSITMMGGTDKNLFAGISNGKVHNIISGEQENKFRVSNSFNISDIYAPGSFRFISEGSFVTTHGSSFFDIPAKYRKALIQNGEYSGSKAVEINKKGEMIIAGMYEVIYCDPEGNIVRRVPVPVRINCINSDPEGELYLGCKNGLWIMKDHLPVYLGDSFPAFRNTIKSILRDRNGDLWVCTWGGGIIIKKGHKQYLLNDSVPGLSMNCSDITEDPEGTLWIGSNNGLYAVDQDKRTINWYNTSHGLSTNEIKTVRYFNGHIFIGTPLGVDYFPFRLELKNNTPPPITISKINIDEDVAAISGTIDPFPFHRNDIEFSFIGLTFKSDAKKQYQYRLTGYDPGWKQTSNENIKYTNLAPGKYTFSVYSINNDGVPSSKPAQVSFSILIPWWQQPWLLIAEVIATLLLLTFIVYACVRILKTRQDKKAKVERLLVESRLTALRAQMNPHFIFNVINSIQHFILHNDKEKAYDYLARFSRLIRMVLDNSEFTTLTLEKEIQLLTLYVDLEKLRFEHEFDFRIDVRTEQSMEILNLPNMLIQPYVENAIIHGIAPKKEKGVIEVKFIQEGNILMASIYDNGIGRERSKTFRKNSQHRSAGMSIAAERLKMIGRFTKFNIKIMVTDLRDKNGKPSGTRVDLSIPIL